MNIPTNREEWLNIANSFFERWNTPNNIGNKRGKPLECIGKSGLE
jgi:hypothetical protein